ncbi:hypothetical protein SAMN05444581_10875 [Methylocapsa palsarum]|uniref:Ion channel n=1 Tax=Methylocapsa palsarum TaxID=1612308 RepID=A0A1I3ZNG0_9HYPH|nr:hypothetical protein SAMN05444581_10875 [Methylocapsa palsarum]
MDALAWNSNWAWSAPLIVLTVILHVIGLGIINERAIQIEAAVKNRRHFLFFFGLVMGITTLFVTVLHGIEASIWAVAYRLLGALPDTRDAVLYSLGAMTTYGHAGIFLAPHWRLMGALEALNGMMLFGLTTAFMFAIIQRIWPPGSEAWPPRIRWPKRKNPPIPRARLQPAGSVSHSAAERIDPSSAE